MSDSLVGETRADNGAVAQMYKISNNLPLLSRPVFVLRRRLTKQSGVLPSDDESASGARVRLAPQGNDAPFVSGPRGFPSLPIVLSIEHLQLVRNRVKLSDVPFGWYPSEFPAFV